jgi:hypothetical protein
VVKALGYKAEGRGFQTQWGEIFNLPNPSGRTKNVSGELIAAGAWDWQPYRHLWADSIDNVESTTNLTTL